jgi:hypothetical protein
MPSTFDQLQPRHRAAAPDRLQTLAATVEKVSRFKRKPKDWQPRADRLLLSDIEAVVRQSANAKPLTENDDAKALRFNARRVIGLLDRCMTKERQSMRSARASALSIAEMETQHRAAMEALEPFTTKTHLVRKGDAVRQIVNATINRANDERMPDVPQIPEYARRALIKAALKLAGL